MDPENNPTPNQTSLPETPQVNTPTPEQPVAESQPSPVTPPTQETPVVPSPTPSSSTFPATTPTDTNQSFSQSMSTTPMPATPKRKLNIGTLLALIAGGLLAIGGIVAAVLFLVIFPGMGKVNESDLISSTTDGTSYLRPKQWSSVTVDNANGYGDKLGKDGESTAAIFAQKSSYVQSGIGSASDAQISSFRQAVSQSLTSTRLESLIKTSTTCDTIKDVTSATSSTKQKNSIGVFTVTATCIRENVTYKAVYYALLGNDGYAREVFLMASDSSWKKNEAVFNKMLDSADQE